jgi:hypothetical protein
LGWSEEAEAGSVGAAICGIVERSGPDSGKTNEANENPAGAGSG